MKEEIRKKRAEEKLRKESELDPRYVTKDDITKLEDVVMNIAKSVNELAHLKANPPIIIEKNVPEIEGTADLSKIKESSKSTPIPTDEQIAGGSEKAPIPPAWRKLVDEILGMDFGINVSYPLSGGGFLFKIIVPAEKSNMSKDYKEFYKTDVRTKSINYNEGADGVRKFLELVKKNLEKKAEN
jgi:aspartyl/asparaginyl-tRNA synthetase